MPDADTTPTVTVSPATAGKPKVVKLRRREVTALTPGRTRRAAREPGRSAVRSGDGNHLILPLIQSLPIFDIPGPILRNDSENPL